MTNEFQRTHFFYRVQPIVGPSDESIFKFQIGSNAYTNQMLQMLARKVIEKERAMLSDERYKYSELGGIEKRSLITLWKSYNVLEWEGPEIDYLKMLIAETAEHYFQARKAKVKNHYIQCWANLMRFGDYVGPHHHGSKKGVSGVLYLSPGQGHSGQVRWGNVKAPFHVSTAKPNSGYIFQSDIQHSVEHYFGSEPRISIAWDIKEQKIPGHRFVDLHF